MYVNLVYAPLQRIDRSFMKSFKMFQLEETFTLRLQNYNNQTATIGSRSSITVKVMENDKPYGVLQFKETSLLTYLSEY